MDCQSQAKKLEKKKKQGDESTDKRRKVFRSPKHHPETVAQYHADHHKATLELDTKVGQHEIRQDTNFDFSQSGASCIRSLHSSKKGTTTGQTSQYSEATTSPGKKKKKKKKKKSTGILTSELNPTLPKATDKGKKTRKEEEYASSEVLSCESKLALPRPTVDEEGKETQHDEEYASSEVLSCESKLALPRPAVDEEGKKTQHDEEYASSEVLSCESKLALPRPTGVDEEGKETQHDEEYASSEVLSCESKLALPRPTVDEEGKETQHDEEYASSEVLSCESKLALPRPTVDEEGKETHKNGVLGEEIQYSEATTSPAGKKKNKNLKKKKKKSAGILTSELNPTLSKATDKGKTTHKEAEDKGIPTSTKIPPFEQNVTLPSESTNKEGKEKHNDKEPEENQCSEATTSPGKKRKKKKKSTGILTSELNPTLPKATDKGKKTQEEEGASSGVLSCESKLVLPRPTVDEEGKETQHEEEYASSEVLSCESKVTLQTHTVKEGMETHNDEEGGSQAKEAVVEASSLERIKLSDLERFSNENKLLTKKEKERQNLYQVLRLVYDVGLNALRKLFMEIHPTWINARGDALNLDPGSMKLMAHESASFDEGDIHKWDISLITTVLLYSKKCKDEISKKPGFEDAIRSIKDHKNNLVSHASNDKMSDADYQVYWPAISGHLETIGVSKEEIDEIFKENVLENGKIYRDLFLQGIAAQSVVASDIREVKEIVQDIRIAVVKPTGSSQSEIRNQLSPRRGGPNWDEWMKFRNNVRNFDHLQNNYILITDAMTPELMEHFSIFRCVPWKLVLDFDPSSEEKGIYQDFASKDGKNSLINMNTPAEIGRKAIADLARHIDANKTQWMFVNGRENDGSNGGPQDFEDWEDNAVGDISTFFKCCSEPDKLDKNEPLVCLVLPFREKTVPFINATIKRLLENFKEFDINFVGITPKDQSCPLPDKMLKKINMHTTNLEPQLLRLGMEDLFDTSSEQSYCMPTSQANVPAKLPQTEYLYFKEYLDVLYEGCENLPNGSDIGEDGQKPEDLVEEHKKSFMSGNWISFVSLYYNHDAKREISNDIRTHIQRLLDQGLTDSTIIEISHSPGSGGSTIARRVMWDIHKSYPCAFAKLEDHKFDLEDDNVFLESLADRITALRETCHTTPVVLLDGKHTRIEALSNRLVRILNCRGERAVLLRCNHNLDESKARSSTLESSDVHATFSVNVRLEESKADLKEFESKYKDHIKEFKNIRSLSDLSRVFHFPLFAMLEKFRNKLQNIIFESFDEMTAIEKEIVTVVAFIQRFAAQAIPAPLLSAIFQESIQDHQSSTLRQDLRLVTYEDISTIMSERLCNLMVPANPAKFIYLGRGFKRANYFHQMYTLQHPVVAEMVLHKAKVALKRDTLALARDFLGFPIFDDKRFIPLMKDLFVLNGSGQGRFSELFQELKVMHSHEAGDVFYEAAEKTKVVVVVTSAARFYAKVPPRSFPKAKELMDKAFECTNAEEKQKTIYDVKGVVLLKELEFLAKSGKIPTLERLQSLAQGALESFRKAQTFPPSFPNPLIGEVKTWVTCIEWITKNIYNGNSMLALHFIMSYNSPPFFQGCVSNSFHLLNIVDHIAKSVKSLSDPEKTQKEANNVRLSLMKTYMKTASMSERRMASEIIQECKNLCSAEMFHSSSQMELKRLQVQYVFSCVKKIENIDKSGLEYLLTLLKDLVEVEKEGIFANYLMRICVLITGPQQYSLDQGLAICKIWNKKSKYEALPHFYEMMIYFMKILDGNVMEFRSRYLNALENCREKSQNNCRNTMPTHFLGKTGIGMSRLLTINTLFRGETPFIYDAVYWKTKSRKRLRECCGRIRSRPSGGKKTYLTVELIRGNIELYVAKSAGIGRADQNFVPGSMVYFVVSFNLRGPVANGITFRPHLLSRQQSLNNS